MDTNKLRELRVAPGQKQRTSRSIWTIFLVVLAVTGVALFLAWPRASDKVRIFVREGATATNAETRLASAAGNTETRTDVPPRGQEGDAVLTVSGYIINGTRIELSPRFMGVVKWIGVEKGDSVTNGQVLVLLDDTEYRARLQEVQGRLANADAALKQAELSYDRINRLARTDIESEQARDDATLRLESARATLRELQGTRQLAQAYLNWCTIRSPIDGVILEKLVDPDELVTPQSFGGTRGPSTALVALANPQDIQIEIDMNESDLSKVSLNQKCRVSPEAYPDKSYEGYVKEIAPEANRSKGTLQIKVQVNNPDHYLTPELSARVDFLR
ncbi:MAG: efflux RND transporter periplasmic adaptor subunit [Verrucomicrobia bacterium]|jgi:RND family efflux transporter MFP subunit|nr:efflux RND transporter periplasmic adaptor subunit [Verrucomicrobiota bacterium]